MNAILRSALAVAGLAITTQAVAEIVLYEREDFEGRSYTANQQIPDFNRSGFNDRASSVAVLDERWEVCEHAGYGGKCIVLRPGRYPSLAAMGLNNSISSVRIVTRNARVSDNRYAPVAAPVYDNRRRNGEQLYQAPVTSVRAVVATPQQRCWVEQQQVAQDQRSGANVPGALIGALIGGVLGHQVGGGRGQDVATAGGAVAGAALGSQVGRSGGSGQQYATRDVQRCETVPTQARADHYDVTYNWRGEEHRIQTAYPPGNTVTVNSRGEPRA